MRSGIAIVLVPLAAGLAGCVTPAEKESVPPPDVPASVSRETAQPADDGRKSGSTSFLVVPGKSVGGITRDTSLDDLKKRYGAGNVESRRIELGEGETVAGAVVFPNDPTRMLEIIWADPKARHVAEVRIRSPGSRWKTAEGIGVGTSLVELEKLNGKPFTMAGFNWDYAGTVNGWNDGKLRMFDREPRTYIRLSPKTDTHDGSLAGDREFPSDHPAMKKTNPVIYEIIVNFETNSP